ncbi:uncharacterized protein BDR25DRAFT_121958 [Lindgomyces ingoldianus]|uniref:Uncharacterized protein n=1 Tax=Lindgomyces ingoldianus TaxID=673940 RepID=A0ACB6R5I1_9PLEO|nr:uncharacterized protein BDR25DRAFT_121958 [Lindgomyces ingoldianus]KAF2474436.1 hypothetical protein BDR25DRAFT_121958 [Lindgomyces ingoldianus]
MDAVSAAIGVVALIPQCVSSAKELYDLRSRYKDASVLISAIYSESMVIAASLSQVQSLLQRDALQNKPELHETFDRALTGCRVVYVCLEEEVRELAGKANNNELRSRDRLKYLWREETFKELLQQIRGQQSALSLLIQGLQMESIADIKKLVQDNGAKLDLVASRSKSLRQSHPKVKVPRSVFDQESNSETLVDAQSILRSAQFVFDDEVINSTAYRRAMALATLQTDSKDPAPNVIERNLVDLKTPHKDDLDDLDHQDTISRSADDLKSLNLTSPSPRPAEEQHMLNDHDPEKLVEENDELLDSLERDLLPFMLPMPSATSKSAIAIIGEESPLPTISESFHNCKRSLVDEPTQTETGSESRPVNEKPPPLPPRRPTAPVSVSARSSASTTRQAFSEDSASIVSDPSIFSATSTTSSRTLSEPTTSESGSSSTFHASTSIQRKGLPTIPISRKASYDIFSTLSTEPEDLIRVASAEDVEIHNIWVSLVEEEQKFIDRITKFRRIFYDPVIAKWPILEKHLEVIIIGEQLVPLQRQYLLETLEGQISQTSFATCNPAVFEAWVSKVHKVYREYAQRLPHAESAVRVTSNADPKFSPFIGTLGLSIIWFGKGWEDYLELPISQLNVYVEKLERLLELTPTASSPLVKKDELRLKRALEIVQRLRSSCQRLMEESKKHEELQSLYRRIHTLNANFLSQLSLSDTGRRILIQGGLAIKLRGEGSWQPVHAVLLDNYLFWGKVKPPKSKSLSYRENRHATGGSIWVLEAPIPIASLEINLPGKENQFQRATIMDDIPRGSVLYQLFVKDNTSESHAHTLGVSSVNERRTWYDHFIAAIAAHGAATCV